jgi:hypothetical protein
VLPISADGRSVDVSNASVIAERSAPTTVSINFYNSAESAFVGDEVYISNVDKLDINQMYAVKQLDPYSIKFRETIKSDFHEFFNEKQNAQGFKNSGGYIMTKSSFPKTIFCELNQYTDTMNLESGIVIAAICGINAPLFQVHFLDNEMAQRYYVPNTVSGRKTMVYKYNNASGSYSMVKVHNNYGLFPAISLYEWSGSKNGPEFRVVVYQTSMGWGDTAPDKETVYMRYHANGWLKELFYRTYLFIAYGSAQAQPVEDDAIRMNLDAMYTNLVSAQSIEFVSSNMLDGTTENLDNNNTQFVLHKSTFDSLL